MNSDRTTLFVPLLLISIGAGWLLTTLKVAPGIDWVWTLSLVALGLLTILVGGLDKVSVVVGPLFIAAGMLSLLRQTSRLSLDVEVPILVILTGVLLLVGRLSLIPSPRWILPDPKERSKFEKP